MRPITSTIDRYADRFVSNSAAYRNDLDQLAERMRFSIEGGRGRQRSIERHHSRGKVMVRERIDLVTDNATPFLEFSTLSAWGQYDDEAPGAGIVTGIGLVHLSLIHI